MSSIFIFTILYTTYNSSEEVYVESGNLSVPMIELISYILNGLLSKKAPPQQTKAWLLKVVAFFELLLLRLVQNLSE